MSEPMLSPELMEALGGSSQGELVSSGKTTKDQKIARLRRQKKASEAAEPLTRAERRLSKSKLRKLKKLQVCCTGGVVEFSWVSHAP